jgi:SAM-dependent methyltransferase
MGQERDQRSREVLDGADLKAAWAEHSESWIRWAREPGHDSYWQFHRDQFLARVPPAGCRTLDLGCGEGRVSRDLRRLGHQVVGVDISPAMVEAARRADSTAEILAADAASLPFDDASFDCVVAFMSLQDFDDYEAAIHEASRVLEPRGRFCAAVVHPLASAGAFEGGRDDSPFVIPTSYLNHSYYADHQVRDGLEMEFVSAHRPMEAYTEAIADAGLAIERLREIGLPRDFAVRRPKDERWKRFPLFLHIRAVKLMP